VATMVRRAMVEARPTAHLVLAVAILLVGAVVVDIPAAEATTRRQMFVM
jgi:hypothetical protein